MGFLSLFKRCICLLIYLRWRILSLSIDYDLFILIILITFVRFLTLFLVINFLITYCHWGTWLLLLLNRYLYWLAHWLVWLVSCLSIRISLLIIITYSIFYLLWTILFIFCCFLLNLRYYLFCWNRLIRSDLLFNLNLLLFYLAYLWICLNYWRILMFILCPFNNRLVCENLTLISTHFICISSMLFVRRWIFINLLDCLSYY
jgi:hypothetical protein